jgi:hypothetical protein
MDLKAIGTKAIVLFALCSFAIAPISASAQSSKHRQQTKNTWRNVAIGSGALGLYGLLKGDTTLAFAGAAGALYSANRYEQDRKSQSQAEHARYQMFSRRSYMRNGHRYVRRTVYKHGQKYYQFVRAS